MQLLRSHGKMLQTRLLVAISISEGYWTFEHVLSKGCYLSLQSLGMINPHWNLTFAMVHFTH